MTTMFGDDENPAVPAWIEVTLVSITYTLVGLICWNIYKPLLDWPRHQEMILQKTTMIAEAMASEEDKVIENEWEVTRMEITEGLFLGQDLDGEASESRRRARSTAPSPSPSPARNVV